ncbi:MAG: holo-ACP synthase [Firmicutes bacterium]|nr:holo-ACP synthase [Bacillota bacterium]
MSVIGIGTDIVSIVRIRDVLERNPRFAERVLTPYEMPRFQSHANPAAFLAKRWAAKEAAAKALGTGIGKVSFQHIVIESNAAGQPFLTLLDEARAQAGLLGARQYHVSMSDEKDYAIAYVVLSSN